MRIWALLGAKRGDTAQVERLLELLGWQANLFHLRYNFLSYCRNVLLGASLASLKEAKPPFAPPWPDVVISIGQRSVPAARWIRAQSDGRTRIVQMGRPQAPLEWFDHVITTPQYALPRRRNVTHLLLPLTQVAPERLARAAKEWRWRFEALPRPLFAVLVGGPSHSVRLGLTEGWHLLDLALERQRTEGGTLLVSTSPRTPREVANVIERHLPAQSVFYRHDRPDGCENPLLGYLAHANAAIITQDSVSMLADTVSAGLPTQVVELPKRWAGRWSSFYNWTLAPRLPAKVKEAGLIPAAPDLRALREELFECGVARPVAGGFEVHPNELQEICIRRAVAAVRALAGQLGGESREVADDGTSTA